MDHRPSFDPAQALADLGGNRLVLCEMIDAYLADLEPAVAALAAASAAADQQALAEIVHRLRGSFAVLYADAARRAAVEIEDWLEGAAAPPLELVEQLIEAARRLAADARHWRSQDPV